MLMPRKVKHRKVHRGKRRGKAWRGSGLDFGDFGLKSLETAWITDRQIEAARVAITRHVRRGGKLWIRIFPDKPITKKPAETRMGKRQGSARAVGRGGQARPHDVRSRGSVPKKSRSRAMKLAAQKLPIKTKFVSRQSGGLL